MPMFKRKQKIFCIGTGKTGTTSVEQALKDFGYKMGDQAKGELLIHEYGKRNFDKIVEFCRSAEAFQDAPFCFKYTYMALDMAFPGSKFILTERDSSELWYQSLIKFHSKIHVEEPKIPSIEDLKNATYRYKGYAWDVRQIVYGMKEGQDPYDKEILINYYEDHNAAIKDYFRHKDNLLQINLSDTDAYSKFCSFIGKAPLYKEFPWENKTSEIVKK